MQVEGAHWTKIGLYHVKNWPNFQKLVLRSTKMENSDPLSPRVGLSYCEFLMSNDLVTLFLFSSSFGAGVDEDERAEELFELPSRETSWCTGNTAPGPPPGPLTSDKLTSRLFLFFDLSITGINWKLIG